MCSCGVAPVPPSLPVQRRLRDQRYLAQRAARADPPTHRLCMRAMLTAAYHLLQGKRHQQNLAKRAAWEAQDKPTAPAPQKRAAVSKTVKIGRPGYRVTKQFASDTKQRSLLFQVGYFCHLGANRCSGFLPGSAGNSRTLSDVTSEIFCYHPTGGVPGDRGGVAAAAPLHELLRAAQGGHRPQVPGAHLAFLTHQEVPGECTYHSTAERCCTSGPVTSGLQASVPAVIAYSPLAFWKTHDCCRAVPVLPRGAVRGHRLQGAQHGGGEVRQVLHPLVRPCQMTARGRAALCMLMRLQALLQLRWHL